MMLCLFLGFTLGVGQDRGFSRFIDTPTGLNVLYWSSFVDDHLWLGRGKIFCLSREGKVVRRWDLRGGSIAPDGEGCWAVSTVDADHIHHLKGDLDYVFSLGRNASVYRCHESKDVLSVAGNAVWLLNEPHPRRLFERSKIAGDVVLDALTRNEIVVVTEDLAETHATAKLFTESENVTVTVPSRSAEVVLRASRDMAFLIAQSGDATDSLVLYRIDISTKGAHIIAHLRRDYMESLAWDNSSKSIYVNYSDGKCSRVESLSATGKIRWRSKRFIEFVTGISLDKKRNEIYCATKVGGIYVLKR